MLVGVEHGRFFNAAWLWDGESDGRLHGKGLLVIVAMGCCLASWCIGADAELAVLRAVESLHALVADAEFNFEGELSDGLAKIHSYSPPQYTGKAWYRRNDAFALDRAWRIGGKMYRITRSYEPRNVMNEIIDDERELDPMKRVRQDIATRNVGGPLAGGDGQSPVPIWAPMAFSEMRSVPPLWASQTHLGLDKIDGIDCEKFSFGVSPVKDRPPVSTWTFWIDMSRGGNLLRTEHAMRGNLVYRVGKVRLAELPAANGVKVWFPASAECEAFGFIGNPGKGHWTYSALAGTIKINSGLAHDAVVVRFDKRRLIGNSRDRFLQAVASAEGRGASAAVKRTPERGNKARAPLAENRAKIDDLRASVEVAEPPRAPANGTPWWTYGLASTGAFALLAAGIVRRRAA